MIKMADGSSDVSLSFGGRTPSQSHGCMHMPSQIGAEKEPTCSLLEGAAGAVSCGRNTVDAEAGQEEPP
jgi:hypothetical protein